MKKHPCIFTFVSVVLLCALMLCASMFFPQNAIRDNVAVSLKQLNIEGNYPLVFDNGADANMLDNTTDALMLMQSFYSCEWDSLWKNSWNKHDDGLVAGLNETILENAPTNYTYSRYWAGCRVPLRMLLSFFSYTEIRHIVSIVFFSLFVMVCMCVYKHSDFMHVAAFALSIILMRPEIISNTLQYSCCYLIAFVAMCFMPWVLRKSYSLPAVFITLGCLTQYFDYYTTPLVTYAYPFLMVLIMMEDTGNKDKLILFYKTVGAWFISWLAMWLMKLVFTSLFTDENAFANAIRSVSGRLGFQQIAGIEDSYNPLLAILIVFRTLFQSPRMLAVVCSVIALFAVVAAIHYRPNIRQFKQAAQSSIVYILIAMLPFLWFACTCSPTILHAFFQYRSVCVLIFAGLLWVLEMFLNSSTCLAKND